MSLWSAEIRVDEDLISALALRKAGLDATLGNRKQNTSGFWYELVP